MSDKSQRDENAKRLEEFKRACREDIAKYEQKSREITERQEKALKESRDRRVGELVRNLELAKIERTVLNSLDEDSARFKIWEIDQEISSSKFLNYVLLALTPVLLFAAVAINLGWMMSSSLPFFATMSAASFLVLCYNAFSLRQLRLKRSQALREQEAIQYQNPGKQR